MDFDFTSYLWIKFFVILGAAFVWGMFCELTGRQLSGEPNETAPTQEAPLHSRITSDD